MILKTVENDITGVTDKISIFNSTLSTMQRNLKSGQGVLYSFFGGNKITQNDVQAITNYVNAVKSGVGTGKAWQTTMSNCSVAAKQYVVSAKRAGQSTTELVTGLKTVPKATTAASIGLKALSIAGNMLMFWAITEGIQLAIKALDKLIVTTKEAKEVLDNSVSSFKSATDELKGLESELKTTSDRLSELQKLADNNTISIAEEKELELLKQQNAELARKIALKKEEQIDTAKQVLKDAKKYSDKKVTSSYVYVAGTYDVPQYDYISAVDEMSIALDKYYSNTNRTSTNQQNPKDVIENMYAIIEPTIEAYEALINADYKLSDAEQAHYEKLRSLQDRYLKFRYDLNGMKETYQALSVEQQKNILLNRLIAQGLSDIQANAVLGSVSESDYASLWEKGFTFTPPQMTDYTTAEEYGKAYADAWLNGVESVVESTDEKPVSFSGFSEEQSKAIEDFESKLKTLSTTLSSLRDGSYKESDFANLVKDFPDLQGKSENLEQAIKDLINDSLQQLYNTLGKPLPDDVKNSLQSMVDEAVNASVSLDDAFSAIQKSYEALNDFEEAQKGLGITSDVLNSVASLSTEMENLVAQYYAGLVGADELYAGLTEHYNNDMENYANALIVKNANSEQFYQSTGMMSAEVINSFMEDYNVDLSNCKTYNEAKLAIEQQALQKISTMWARYYDAQAKTINATGKHLLEQAETLKALDENAYHNFMSANDLYGFQNVVNTYKEASEALNDITFNGIESNFKLTSKNIAKATNAAKEAGKSAKDEFEELFDFFERRVKVLDNALDLLKTNLDNVIGSFAKNTLIDAQLGVSEEKFKNYTDALAMYTSKANEALSKLPSDIAQKIQDGAVDLTTFVGDGNKEVVEAIKDYEQWADKVADCKQQLAELKTAIRQLELEKFNNIIKDFTDQFDLREDGKDLISKQIDLLKEAGQLIGTSLYATQLSQSKKQLELLEQEKVKLVEQMNNALNSGRVKLCPAV